MQIVRTFVLLLVACGLCAQGALACDCASADHTASAQHGEMGMGDMAMHAAGTVDSDADHGSDCSSDAAWCHCPAAGAPGIVSFSVLSRQAHILVSDELPKTFYAQPPPVRALRPPIDI